MNKPSQSSPRSYQNLYLDNQLCFALYVAANSVTRAYREPLGRLGLTYPQHLVMLALWERGTQTVSGLAQALHLDSSTLTPLLKRLESAGFVSRTRDIEDERVVRIDLTSAGKALRRAVSQVQQSVSCQTQLPAAELADLRTRLHALARTMSAVQLTQALV